MLGRPAAVLHVPAGSLGGASDALPLPPDLVRSVHFGGGGPESAGFCEGPGPGMALEQKPFPDGTPTGLALTVIRRTDVAA